MRALQLLITVVAVITAAPSFGINPVMPLRSFDNERGFTSVIAYNEAKTGITGFTIAMNPKIFLTHFKHGFPPNRVTDVRVTLRARNSETFKGLTVELGRAQSTDTEEFKADFEVPTTDLKRYDLEFQCSIPWSSDEMPIIGGELYHASLQDFRDAKDTITETHPIWKELEEECRKHSPPLQEGDSKQSRSGAMDFGGNRPFSFSATPPFSIRDSKD